MQENRRIEKIKQIIGELISVSPIIVISYFIGLLFQALLSVVLIFTFKLFYNKGYHTPKKKEYICIIITYSIMTISLSIAYLFKGQYYTQIIFVSLVCFVNAYIGEWQENSDKFILIKEPYIKLRDAEIKRQSFNINSCTELDLVNRCQNFGFSKEKTQKAIEHFVFKLPLKELAIKYGVEIKSIETERYRMKNKLK